MDFLIDTWKCATCNYKQDFEPTAELMAVHYPFVPPTLCPACYSGKNKDKLKQESVLVKTEVSHEKISIKVATDAELQAHEIRVLDANGLPIKTNGKEVYRPITKVEIDELKLKRDADLAYLTEATWATLKTT